MKHSNNLSKQLKTQFPHITGIESDTIRVY